MSNSTLRTCKYGHKYYKSSDCPTCPVCEENKKPKDGFMAELAAPARRALEKEKITSLMDLSKWSEEEIMKLHGIGPTSIPKLKKALKEEGLQFK
jgi:DNA-directed RNA polymerase alpha subunit